MIEFIGMLAVLVLFAGLVAWAADHLPGGPDDDDWAAS